MLHMNFKWRNKTRNVINTITEIVYPDKHLEAGKDSVTRSNYSRHMKHCLLFKILKISLYRINTILTF